MKKIFSKTFILSTMLFVLPGCGQTEQQKPVEVITYEKVDGLKPTCVESGYKDYYYASSANLYAENEQGTIKITDIEAWKNEGGNGYLPIDSKAHRLIEEEALAPTFDQAGHRAGYTCELCHKHFTSADGSVEVLDKDWVKAALSATEITSGLVYLKANSNYSEIDELSVEGVDLSTYSLYSSENKPLEWSSLASGSELNVYFVKNGSKTAYKARAVVYEEVNHLPVGMQEFLKLDDSKSADYLYKYYLGGEPVGNPTGVKLEWKNSTGKSQNLIVSEKKDYSNPVYTESLAANVESKAIYNLTPLKTYFAKVTSESGEVVYKDVFRLYGTVRTMNVDNVYNMRDIGGYMTESGKRVKYGLLYRSGKFDGISAQGKADIAKLGIKTDLELRFDGAATSYVDGLNYVKAGLYHWGHCFPNAVPSTPAQQSSMDGMKLAIETMADVNNYPIDFHCSGGADRTATVAFVVEGLLGMSYEDMARDVELTTFSTYGLRLRAPVSIKNDTYQYDLTSETKDKSGFIPSFQVVYNYINDTYVGEGETFSDGIEKYLLNTIGVSQENINAIKEILLN